MINSQSSSSPPSDQHEFDSATEALSLGRRDDVSNWWCILPSSKSWLLCEIVSSTRYSGQQTRYLETSHFVMSKAKIFLATVNCQCLIMRIDANNVYAWSHSHIMRCTCMDIYAHQSCVQMHLFLVCRAKTIHAIHIDPGNKRQLAACTGIIHGRSLSI